MARTPHILAAGTIVLAGVLAYHNSFQGPFIFDDAPAILGNPTVRHLWPIWPVLHPPAGLGVGGRPVCNLSFALNWALGGARVAGYHALNLAVHILAGLALFGIVRRTWERGQSRPGRLSMERADPSAPAQLSGRTNALGSARSTIPTAGTGFLPALAVAVLWVVHPLQTSTVTYISERAEGIMGLFYLLTLYCFIRHAENRETLAPSSTTERPTRGGRSAQPEEGERKQVPKGWLRRALFGASEGVTRKRLAAGWAALSIAFCFLGMGTKEVMVTAPVLVLLYDRTFWAGSFREAWRRHGRLYLGLAASWLLLAHLLGGIGQRGAGFGSGCPWWAYALTECQVVVRYLQLAVWPHPLLLDHDIPIVHRVPPVLPYLLPLAALLGAVAVALRRRPALGFLGCWFFLILAPTSSVVPVAWQPMGENRMYLPLAAVVVLAVLGLQAWGGRRSWPACLALAGVLGGLTVERNADFRSEAAIWSDNVAKRPGSARGHGSLGSAYWNAGRPADAVAQFQESVRLDPGYFLGHLDLAKALAKLGQGSGAIAQFRAALRIDPNSAEAHAGLGGALARAGQPQEAVAEYHAALRIEPDYAAAHNDLGLALAQIGRLAEAIAQYQSALRADPDFFEAHVNWGIALAALSRRAEAATQYREALRINPGFARAHNDLGVVLADSGQFHDAVSEYEAAVRLDPNYANARYNLGIALAALGRRPEAIAQFEAALRLNPDLARARARLEQLQDR